MLYQALAPEGERSNRTMTLASDFGRRIASGEIEAGAVLPTEKELQVSHGVSRTVVREAIRHLAAKGLVTVGPKVGTKVRDRLEWNMLDADVMNWHMSDPVRRGFVDALYEMRLINEPAAARLAARRIDEPTAARLRRALAGMAENERGSPELIAADLDFHRVILEATGNPILVSLGAMIERSLKVSFSLSWRRNPQDETIRQHERVMNAILAGDGEAASLFMRRLIESAYDDVSAALFQGARSGENDTEPAREARAAT
ncbi:FadR/GntR family transcriptional regulator [Aurantimonas sp. Leaf443]|uniref:FadR/GntR family transcriptional regulator n=1 Tax=Aurantimonas sp. Leaf443 TaxID=1736378 RepID=UPI0006F3C4EB|nr:FadR/GntR family transcriptional regulator [Aurantimonas sp. Leaf443]KQT88182.1 transcriptional regulator [Aurantimonas sp. Leaf443]